MPTAIPRRAGELHPLQRHGRQLFERQFGLSRPERESAQTIQPHYEFIASYTWSHAIDDSTDLQATLTPQDSYFPAADRSTSLFDQRASFRLQRRLSIGQGRRQRFGGRFFSNWTVAPLVEFGSGGPSTSLPATMTTCNCPR